MEHPVQTHTQADKIELIELQSRTGDVQILYLTLYGIYVYRYCVFSLNFVIFLNSASSASALVLYLLCECTHTDTEREQKRPESGIS